MRDSLNEVREWLNEPTFSLAEAAVFLLTLIPAIHGDWTIAALTYLIGCFALGRLERGGSDA